MSEELKQVLEREKAALLKLPNVVGVGIGHKRVGGKSTGQPSLIVLVKKKLPAAQLAAADLVPPRVGGVPTDVVEVGDIRALGALPLPLGAENNPRTRKMRPARPGVSIGHYKITAGTFGAVVYDRQSRAPLILSNNHVLANSTSDRARRASVGDPIWQPGRYDGGSSEDLIARLERFVPLHFRRLFFSPKAKRPNLVDAAVARPLTPQLISDEIMELGRVQGIAEAQPDLEVTKSGRTTGVTSGRVIALHASLDVGYDGGRQATFVEQVVAEPMSSGGDSGSLVLTRDLKAVGLLFAGSAQATIFSPIQTVLDLLDLDLMP
ncbi:MAG: hypothetical protein QJR13_02345 [Bacillota bacterium]|nr:hypothetical protein [Bacillota bacterium]